MDAVETVGCIGWLGTPCTDSGEHDGGYLLLGMYRGQFFTEYRVPSNKTVFAELEYRVVDCLCKHAQHKLNGCWRKCTAYSAHRYLKPRLRLAIDVYKKPQI